MIVEETVVFKADHPALAGHFPDDPILPGVALLDEALNLARDRGGWNVTGISRAKFRTALSPGAPCIMRFSENGDGVIGLTCTSQGLTILTATLEFRRRNNS